MWVIFSKTLASSPLILVISSPKCFWNISFVIALQSLWDNLFSCIFFNSEKRGPLMTEPWGCKPWDTWWSCLCTWICQYSYSVVCFLCNWSNRQSNNPSLLPPPASWYKNVDAVGCFAFEKMTANIATWFVSDISPQIKLNEIQGIRHEICTVPYDSYEPHAAIEHLLLTNMLCPIYLVISLLFIVPPWSRISAPHTTKILAPWSQGSLFCLFMYLKQYVHIVDAQ